MTSMCAFVPYYMFMFSKYDTKDIIYVGIFGTFVFWISAWIAKKVIDKMYK